MRSPSTVKNALIQQKFCLINCAPVGSVEGMQRSSSVEGMQRSSQRTGMTLTTVSATPAWRSGTKQVEHPEPSSPRTERPPRSRATTTRRHLSTLKSSEYFVALSSRALVHTTRHRLWLLLDAPFHLLPTRTARVMSTASWAPKNNGSPVARTSMALSSCAATTTFMSRSLALHLTVAPASRQTLATAPSGASALVLSLPGRSTRSSVPALSVQDDPAFAERF